MSKYKKNEDLQSIMSNLQPKCCLNVDFEKVEKHTGGKWLIHDTKRRKNNQLHCGDTIFLLPFYHRNRISYTGKTTSYIESGSCSQSQLDISKIMRKLPSVTVNHISIHYKSRYFRTFLKHYLNHYREKMKRRYITIWFGALDLRFFCTKPPIHYHIFLPYPLYISHISRLGMWPNARRWAMEIQ